WRPPARTTPCGSGIGTTDGEKTMKALWYLLLLPGLAAPARADEPVKAARRAWLRGKYGDARGPHEGRRRGARGRPAPAAGPSRGWESEGEYEKALAVVKDALRDRPKEADLHARRAEVLYLRGRWEDAEAAAREAVKQRPDHFAARWVLARVYRDRGDQKRADAECRWFVTTYSDRVGKANEIKDADTLLLVGQAGAENARWHSLAEEFQTVLTELYR